VIVLCRALLGVWAVLAAVGALHVHDVGCFYSTHLLMERDEERAPFGLQAAVRLSCYLRTSDRDNQHFVVLHLHCNLTCVWLCCPGFYEDFARVADDEARHFGWCVQVGGLELHAQMSRASIL
jgi:hypothetical protein